MKRLLVISYMLFLFYGDLFSQKYTDSKSCSGILINGVCWAKCNVDTPGSFTTNPETYGMYYQWNRKKGWPTAGNIVIGWDNSFPLGNNWQSANDPCPTGWRLPTTEEMATLQDGTKVTYLWTSQHGVNGGKFTDKVSGNAIFFPAAGFRNFTDGALGSSLGSNGMYWSSSSNSSITAWCLNLLNSSNFAQQSILKSFGYSVRCVAKTEIIPDSIVKETSETICADDLPFSWADTIFQIGTKTGKYRFQRSSTVTGYDSIVYLTLTVHPTPQLSFEDVICSGYEYSKNGFHLPIVFADTTISDTLQSVWGCDSIRSLYLTVTSSYDTTLYDTVCQGDSYYKHGFSLPNVQSDGYHTLSLLTKAGCDSILSLHLTALPEFQQTIYDSICPSSRYTKHGFNLYDVTTTGSYQLPLKSINGCDSIVTLDLYIYQTYFNLLIENICQGDTIDFLNRHLYESGIYYDTLSTANGCDSIFCINLTVKPASNLFISDMVCYGNGYSQNNFNLPVVFADTLISDTLQNILGCDSIRNLYLTVIPIYNTPLFDTVCQGDYYNKHGFSLPNVQSSGRHTLSLLSQAGCDSILSLDLTVLPAMHEIIYDSICPSSHYIKHGFDLTDVTTPSSFQLPFQTVHGCDSIVTLDLYVYQTYFNIFTKSICQGDTIDFQDRRIFESGIYYDTLSTIKGCDSILGMDLTVNPVYNIQISDVLCEGSSYTEHGFNATQAGTYHHYLKTTSGCDSIITLSLTEEKKIQGSICLLLEDCTTHSYTFFFKSEIPVSSYQWYMGDGTDLHLEEGIHTYSDSGLYQIQLRTETYNGCKNTFSYVQHVPHYLPDIEFHADRQVIDEDYPTVNFSADVLPEMTCKWDFGDGMTGESNSVSHTYIINTKKYYDIILKVTNADGCITENSMQIEVDILPDLVNTFSPNGDGINDVFMIGYRVDIINRNGLRIFTGNNGWDGTYKGKRAPEDTYFYRLYYSTQCRERIKTGFITLIR